MKPIEALRMKHSGDVFVPECKMGPSGSRRLDAWVMLRTWSPPTIIGYEIKTSRSDFLRDEKWREYLGVCHLFYWVAPAGIIDPREVSDGCGLRVIGGKRIVTKVKATRHDPDPDKLARLMSYVLMSRVRIVANMFETHGTESNADKWRRLLTEREGDRIIGHIASRRISEELWDARHRVQRAERRSQSFESLERRLREAGVDPESEYAIATAMGKLQEKDDRAKETILRAARVLAHEIGARVEVPEVQR